MNAESIGQEIREFFIRLADDRALYNDYLDHPLKAMRAAGLSEEAIGLILQGDLSRINELVQAAQGEQADAASAVICGTIVRT
jgi:hypothetical protein